MISVHEGAVSIPEEIDDEVGAGAEFVFDKGSYATIMEAFELRELPTQGQTWAGYGSSNVEVLSVQFGSLTPLENQTDPGARKFFLDIVLADGDTKITEIDWSDRNSKAWQIRRSAKYVTNLAKALGRTGQTSTTSANRNTTDPNFLADLVNGEYVAQRVGIVVDHTRGKRDETTGERKIYPFIRKFFAVDA